MGDQTSIRLPKPLRDRLNVVVAEMAKATGKKITQADWIEQKIMEDENK